MSSKSGNYTGISHLLIGGSSIHKKDLIRNIQTEYAVYMTYIKFGILLYSECKWKTSVHVNILIEFASQQLQNMEA